MNMCVWSYMRLKRPAHVETHVYNLTRSDIRVCNSMHACRRGVVARVWHRSQSLQHSRAHSRVAQDFKGLVDAALATILGMCHSWAGVQLALPLVL